MTLADGVEREAGVARSDLALGARQRVLLAGSRMQEHREILADAPVAFALELFGRRADDDPVALLDRQAEQRVTYGAADLIYLHGRIIP